MRKVEALLWYEGPLTEDESRLLLEMLRNPHPQVAASAFTILAVRRGDDASALREISVEALKVHKDDCVAAMAEHCMQCGTLSAKVLVEELAEKGLEESDPSDYRTASEYFHDILTTLLVRDARKNKAAAYVPAGVQFNAEQRNLLKYASKPEAEAFDYLHGIVKSGEEPKEAKTFFLKGWTMASMLAAYPRVFFEEVCAAMQSEKLTDNERLFFRLYMWTVLFRLDDDQQMRFGEVLLKAIRPMGVAANILWSESGPSDSDSQRLLEMTYGVSACASAYALSVLMARHAGNHRYLLTVATEMLQSRKKGHPITIQLAEFITKNGGHVNEKTLTMTLKKEKVPRSNDETVNTCLRTVMLYLIVSKARKNGKAPVRPTIDEIQWDGAELYIMNYAYKPTEEAWGACFPLLFKHDKSQKYFCSPWRFFLPAISAYPKVFFEEAMAAIVDETIEDDNEMGCCLTYLVDNAHRLDEQQLGRFINLLKEKNLPAYSLWKADRGWSWNH